jgi:serine phosphatase RsbU (regulator of sigma subunit)
MISDNDQAALEARTGKVMRERLLPQYTPMLGGWEVAAYHQAAVNGASARDLYDYMLLPDGRLMISLATVADRGLSAVHLMTTARAAFRTVACSSPSAGRALSVCNNLLCPDIGPNTAITSLFALLDPVSGRLQVANAGFCAPFCWSDGDLVEMREGSDFLGQALDVEFDHDEVLLGPGDAMIFYSPGALGIRPETGEPFGPGRVRGVLNSSGAAGAQAIIDALKSDLAEFADATSLRRVDLTFLALSRPPAQGPAEKPKRSLREELAALGETDTDL